jgi:HAD superfamily hydrolase (TIGR01490 family)
MRLVLVDLDGTLLKGGSEIQFIRHLLSTRRIGWRALYRCFWFALRHGRRFGRHVWKKNKAYLAGLGCEETEGWAAAFAAERLLPLLRSNLQQRVESHLAAGDRVLLLTGSPEFLARPIAEAIGAEGWIATSCAAREGRYLPEAPLRHPFADEKLALARDAAEGLGIALADCIAYADSGDDLALLRGVGTAVAVAPDRRLARVARANGWEVLIESRAEAALRTPLRFGQRA